MKKIQLRGHGMAAAIVLALSIVLMAQHIRAKNVNSELNARLLSTLSQFAKENSLSDEQLESLLGEVVLKSPNMRKGGVGIIDRETFVLLDKERNAVRISGQEWQGEESGKQQIVLINGRHVLSSVTTGDVSKLKILIFMPSEVQYIDLANNTGGTYRRHMK